MTVTRKYTLGNCFMLCLSVTVLLAAGVLWLLFLCMPVVTWTATTAAEKDNICTTILTLTVLAIPAAGWLLWWIKGSQQDADEPRRTNL